MSNDAEKVEVIRAQVETILEEKRPTGKSQTIALESEAGELCEEVLVEEGDKWFTDREALLKEEIGDVGWVLWTIAKIYDIDFLDAIHREGMNNMDSVSFQKITDWAEDQKEAEDGE